MVMNREWKKAAVTRNYKVFDFTVWEIEYIILFE